MSSFSFGSRTSSRQSGESQELNTNLPEPGFWDEPEGVETLSQGEGTVLSEEQQVLFANFKKRFEYALQKSFGRELKEENIVKCFLALPPDIQQTFTEAPVSIPAVSIAEEIEALGPTKCFGFH